MKQATAIPMVTKAAGRKDRVGVVVCSSCVVYKIVYHPQFLTV
jgi:hypothetical protein